MLWIISLSRVSNNLKTVFGRKSTAKTLDVLNVSGVLITNFQPVTAATLQALDLHCIMEHKKCFLCLKECLLIEIEECNVNGKIETETEIDDNQAYFNKNGPVKNQLQVNFLLRKILEVPKEKCCSFLQAYGDPCTWIDCCHSCSILVQKAKCKFDEILQLQMQYDNLQKEIKNIIMKSKAVNDSKWVASDVRSYVYQMVSDDYISTTATVEIEDVSYSDLRASSEIKSNQDIRPGSDQNQSIYEDPSPYLMIGILKTEEIDLDDQDPLELEGIGEILCLTNPYDIQKEEPVDYADGFSERSIGNEEPNSTSFEKFNLPSIRTAGKSKKVTSTSTLQKKTTMKTANLEFETDTVHYQCDVCWKRFVDFEQFKGHLHFHSGERPYGCHLCGQLFAFVDNLNLHMKRHSDEPSHKYRCQYCGKSFKEKFNLTIHTRIHTGEKPYECHFCDKAFAHSNTLKNHIRTHTGEKFECRICRKYFSRIDVLKVHYKNFHGNLNLI